MIIGRDGGIAMADLADVLAGWTETERWVWDRIARGMVADLGLRDRELGHGQVDLDPRHPDGWSGNRRLRSGVLRHMATDEAFVRATPFSGLRILGALVDDAPLDLEYARLTRLLWLDRSRILVPVMARNLRMDGGLSLEESLVAEEVSLPFARIEDSLSFALGTFLSGVNAGEATVGSNLVLNGGVFAGRVCLNGTVVKGAAFLREHAVFRDGVDLSYATISSGLDMQGSRFEHGIAMDGLKVDGSAFWGHATCNGNLSAIGAWIGGALELQGTKIQGEANLNGLEVKGPAFLKENATFGGILDLGGASIGGGLELQGSTFTGKLILNGIKVSGPFFCNRKAVFLSEIDMRYATIGAALNMRDSTFHGDIDLTGAAVTSRARLDGATFLGNLKLPGATIGSTLDLSNSEFQGRVDLTGARIGGEFRLGSPEDMPARWGSGAMLVLRNAQCGAWQDRGGMEASSWPAVIDLEGFTYGRLGGLAGTNSEADMLGRPVGSYAQLFARDLTASPQPYEQLAQVFRAAGEPSKANDILYRARERRRASLLAASAHPDGGGYVGRRLRWLGLSLLNWTIGYGLGLRYFRALFWVAGLSFLGMVLLKVFGTQAEMRWWPLFFASLDELLPIITLDRGHDAILSTAIAPLPPPLSPLPVPQPYWLTTYFYIHKIAGWIIGSFLVAGLAGLTQKS